MEEALEVTDDTASVSLPFVRRVVTTALDHLDRGDMRLSLLLTDDSRIARLHGEFLDDETATDVITFPMQGGAEIVVSVETAHRVAREMGHAFDAELALYVVHGIMHACGHDDVESTDRRAMREVELEILARLHLAVTPVDD